MLEFAYSNALKPESRLRSDILVPFEKLRRIYFVNLDIPFQLSSARGICWTCKLTAIKTELLI